MAQLNWLDSYNFHIDTIDEQHRGILRLINRLENVLVDRDRAEVGQVLNEIIAAISRHFAFEEELMLESGYGHFKAHKRLHDRFIERLVNFSQLYDSGHCIVEEFHPFLVDWFLRHIEDDKDFGLNAAAEMNAPRQKKSGWLARTFGRKE